MKIAIFVFLLSFTTILSASQWYLLGDKNQKYSGVLKTKNSIVWTDRDGNWSVSKPQDNLNLSDITKKDIGYILINNDETDYNTKGYRDDSYNLKKGWNYIGSHIDGVDIEETFKDSGSVEFIYVYEKLSQAWAGYSPDDELMDKILDTRIISLRYIEPNIGFYVYAKKDTKVDIKSTIVNEICQKKIDDSAFEVLLDSGVDDGTSYNKRKSIGVKSRYLSHHKRGVYNDTRVMLIYPKLKLLDKKENMLAYGPAKPKSKINFNKAYEGKTFYMYDYHTKECYEGILPSVKIPPFSVLKKLK